MVEEAPAAAAATAAAAGAAGATTLTTTSTITSAADLGGIEALLLEVGSLRARSRCPTRRRPTRPGRRVARQLAFALSSFRSAMAFCGLRILARDIREVSTLCATAGTAAG